MINNNKNNGFAIAIAWPETYCKQPGAWYDPLSNRLGISKNHYYKVGHAALVLINEEKCYYFDFGRYHAPFQHGRVRSAETDCELHINTVPKISAEGTELLNFNEIINELQNNPACHGEGKLHASYCKINFKKSWNKVNSMKQKEHIPYGPFKWRGSNCSRFVQTAILAGKPNIEKTIKIMLAIPFTPTPKSNVKALNNYTILPYLLKAKPFVPLKPLTKIQRNMILLKPDTPANIPQKAKWLSGEGAGSWFYAKPLKNGIEVTRYSPMGKKECSGIYYSKDIDNFESIRKAKLTYPCNCKVISLIVEDKIMRFDRMA